MLQGIAGLLLCQLAGEVLVRLLRWPVPGPVVGMVLLFGGLLAKGRVPAGLRTASEGLLRHLALLYVPAGVGLMVHFQLIAADWVAILGALVASSVVTIAVTALFLQALTRARRSEG